MNLLHRWLCASARWSEALDRYILPWVLEDVSLGDDVLEIGPGPGLTTERLRGRVTRLTCVEIDRRYAKRLAARTAGTNVSVLCEDATATSLPRASFDSAISLTMLHHLPSRDAQDRLLREVARLLKPGGVFVGVDSVGSRSMRWLHLLDTMVLVEPATFAERLGQAGFVDARVDVNPYAFRWSARRQ